MKSSAQLIQVASITQRTREILFGIIAIPLFIICMTIFALDGMFVETIIERMEEVSDYFMLVVFLAPCGFVAIGVLLLPVHVSLFLQRKLNVEFL